METNGDRTCWSDGAEENEGHDWEMIVHIVEGFVSTGVWWMNASLQEAMSHSLGKEDYMTESLG